MLRRVAGRWVCDRSCVVAALAFLAFTGAHDASAEERASSIASDAEAVVSLREELLERALTVEQRQGAAEEAARSVRDGVHPVSLAIAAEREALAAAIAEHEQADVRDAEALGQRREAHTVWLAVARDELATALSARAAAHESYLTAKQEHDEFAAELGETIEEFNAAVTAFNAGREQEPGDGGSGASVEAQAETLREMEARIVSGRTELSRRRESALDAYRALESRDQVVRAIRAELSTERERRERALLQADEDAAAGRAQRDRSLEAVSRRVRETVAALEGELRASLASLVAARDAALTALVDAFGPEYESLTLALDDWLESGARDGLYTAPGIARFDRAVPRVSALYAAIERIEAPRPAPALNVVEER